MLHTENSKSGEYDDDMTKCGAFLSKVFSVFQVREICAKKKPNKGKMTISAHQVHMFLQVTANNSPFKMLLLPPLLEHVSEIETATCLTHVFKYTHVCFVFFDVVCCFSCFHCVFKVIFKVIFKAIFETIFSTIF